MTISAHGSTMSVDQVRVGVGGGGATCVCVCVCVCVLKNETKGRPDDACVRVCV